jgi:hypothetical protein
MNPWEQSWNDVKQAVSIAADSVVGLLPWQKDYSAKQEQPAPAQEPSPAKHTADSLMPALIQAESRGKHMDASGKLITSKAGAEGITQLMPSTAAKPGFGIEPAKDKSEGEYLRVGKEYLGKLLDKFGGDAEKALAAYNWGLGNLQKAIGKAERFGGDWKEQLPKETSKYMGKILGGTVNTPKEKMYPGTTGAQMLENVKATAYDIASLAPVTGEAISAKEFYSAIKEGNMPSAGLAAIGMIPGVGMIGHAGKMGVSQTILKEAAKLEKAGVTNKEIFDKLGVYKGPVDGEWRAVISDKGMKLKDSGFSVNSFDNSIKSIAGVKKLPEVIDHPELFSKFPFLKDVDIRTGFGQYKDAAYDAEKNVIWIGSNTDEKEMASTILHEIQHAVQSKQGLTRGGSTSAFVADAEKYSTAVGKISEGMNKISKELSNKYPKFNMYSSKQSDEILNDPLYKRLQDYKYLHDKQQKLDRELYSKYKNIGGEAEARATADMFVNEINATIQGPSSKNKFNQGFISRQDESKYPIDFYDVPVEDLTKSPLKGEQSSVYVKPSLFKTPFDAKNGYSSVLNNPIHLKDGTRLSGFTDAKQTTMHGYDKNGERFTVKVSALKSDDIVSSKDSNKTAEYFKQLLKEE